MKILFVCTGNTCRSPMAEYIARDVFEKKGISGEFSSAGTSVFEGGSAGENARKICKARGYDMSGFKSRQVTGSHICGADLVIAMTRGHKAVLNSEFKKYSEKIFTFGEYLGADGFEIPDPFGGDLETYSVCADKLEEAIGLLADKLAKTSSGDENPECMVSIAIGSDHAGFALKNEILEYLREMKFKFTDFGTYSTESVDYPIYAEKVSGAVLSGEHTKGILVCGTGIGISMAANRIKGIRCAICHDVFSAKASREHNDANILAMGGRVIGVGHALEVVKAFLETEFSGENKHVKRISMFN